jgi:hypothetical protein
MKIQYIAVTSASPLSVCDYINFLVAAQCDVSCVKAAECFSSNGVVISHDSLNRFLTRQSLPPETLWCEVEPFVEKRNGWLIADDTVLDKIHSRKMELTYFQWSGNHRKVIRGIGLITLVWTDGTSTFPIDYRIYNKDNDQLSKNDHLRSMLQTAADRGFIPYFVMFDSWYACIKNLKFIRKLGWRFFCRIKKNRLVNPDKTGNVPVSFLTVPDDGMVVHMKEYGFVKIFHSKDAVGRGRYWVTNCLEMNYMGRKNLQVICWAIENYHRALKDACGIDKCKIRKEIGQRNHINCSLRAFIRLQAGEKELDITIYNAKWEIVKDAIRAYVQNPKYAL